MSDLTLDAALEQPFRYPRIAAHFQDRIRKAMIDTLEKPKPIPQSGKNRTRAEKIFELCKGKWKSTAEIAEHIETHVETVRKITKSMHDNAKLERKRNPGQDVVEYLYRSRCILTKQNEKRQRERKQLTKDIIEMCNDWTTSQELAAKLNMSQPGVRRHLRIAQDEGRLQKKGSGNVFKYKRLDDK